MEEFQSEGEIRRKECLETAIFQNGCRSMDDLPGWVKKHVNASVFSSPKVLKSLPVFFGRHGGMDLPSRARRNRRNRFDGTHLPYPGRRPVKPRIYVICDTSGSMFFGQQALLSQALGMLVELQSRRNIPCTFIQCDAEISSIRDVDSNLVTEILSKKMTLKGSGGSNLTQAFDWAWEEGIRHCGVVPIICFTDGLVTVPVKPKCATDVLWILPENGKAPAKWGHFCTL
jgi:predicted metal-dependent peptidase